MGEEAFKQRFRCYAEQDSTSIKQSEEPDVLRKMRPQGSRDFFQYFGAVVRYDRKYLNYIHDYIYAWAFDNGSGLFEDRFRRFYERNRLGSLNYGYLYLHRKKKELTEQEFRTECYQLLRADLYLTGEQFLEVISDIMDSNIKRTFKPLEFPEISWENPILSNETVRSYAELMAGNYFLIFPSLAELDQRLFNEYGYSQISSLLRGGILVGPLEKEQALPSMNPAEYEEILKELTENLSSGIMDDFYDDVQGGMEASSDDGAKLSEFDYYHVLQAEGEYNILLKFAKARMSAARDLYESIKQVIAEGKKDIDYFLSASDGRKRTYSMKLVDRPEKVGSFIDAWDYVVDLVLEKAPFPSFPEGVLGFREDMEEFQDQAELKSAYERHGATEKDIEMSYEQRGLPKVDFVKTMDFINGRKRPQLQTEEVDGDEHDGE